MHEFLIKLLRNIRGENISQWDKDNFNFQCKHLFKEFAEFVALHYALSQRNDTPYWKHLLNKSWEDSLINLLPKGIDGFRSFVAQRTYDYRFSTTGGMHCIAAGMNWSPTDMTTLTTLNYLDTQTIEKSFQTCIHNLDERKERSKKLIKTEKDLFTVLKKIHK